VGLAVALLASSLHSLEFQPGRPLASVFSPEQPITLPSMHILEDTPVWSLLLIWLALVVNLALFLLLLPPEMRKRLLRQLIRFSLGILALALALRYRLLKLPELLLAPAAQGGTGIPGLGASPDAPTFRPPQIAPWLTYVISLLILWGILVLIWIAYRWWRRSRAGWSSPLGEIGDIARTSLSDLAAGRLWSDVVINAYARMTATVLDRRGLQRAADATPREFAARLTRAGLPHTAVEDLTRLFESVRYGGRQSGDKDARMAVACLEAILRSCGAAT
jgi:hypothetical protein